MNNRICSVKHRGNDFGGVCDKIPSSIKSILKALSSKGFEAYLVGGCIRDILLNKKPKDFDVVTNAKPHEIKKIFKNAEIIGRRFIIVHVYVKGACVEVTTFRGADNKNSCVDSRTGMMLKDNSFGTLNEDVGRRDFTCNALYYDITKDEIVDYYDSLSAITDRRLVVIGDATTRFKQDPVRMLRLIRFMAKLNFTCDDQLLEALKQNVSLLANVAPGRRFDEIRKLLFGGYGSSTFKLLKKYNVLNYLFSPESINHYNDNSIFINEILKATDIRVHESKPVIPAYFYANLLWPVYKEILDKVSNNKAPTQDLQFKIAEKVLLKQLVRTSMTRRTTLTIREIWLKQFQLSKLSLSSSLKLIEHPRFRAGYDMFYMRGYYLDGDKRLADFWTKLQTLSHSKKVKFLQAFLDKYPEYKAQNKVRKKYRKRLN